MCYVIKSSQPIKVSTYHYYQPSCADEEAELQRGYVTSQWSSPWELGAHLDRSAAGLAAAGTPPPLLFCSCLRETAVEGTSPGIGDKEEACRGELMAPRLGEQGILSPEREFFKIRRKNWIEQLTSEKVVLERLRDGGASSCKTRTQLLWSVRGRAVLASQSVSLWSRRRKQGKRQEAIKAVKIETVL